MRIHRQAGPNEVTITFSIADLKCLETALSHAQWCTFDDDDGINETETDRLVKTLLTQTTARLEDLKRFKELGGKL